MEKWGYFQQHEKYRCHIARLYTSVIVLGVLKEDLGSFFKPKEALKMIFGVRSIRVFSQFLLDPYYEPLLWFMIIIALLSCVYLYFPCSWKRKHL